MSAPKNVRSQYRVVWTRAEWPATKQPAIRLFRFRHLAEQFIAALRSNREGGALTIAFEEREATYTPWRPCNVGGAQ